MAFLLLTVVLINFTPIQNYLAKKATQILSDKLKTKVSVQHVRVDLLNHLLLQGVYVEDLAHDTLLYSGEIKIRTTDWLFSRGKPVIHYVGVDNTFVHLYRTRASNEWNYDFISRAFASNDTTKTSKATDFDLDLEKIALDQVRFHMDDSWGGMDLDIDLGSMALNAKKLDLLRKSLDVKDIKIENAIVSLKDYKGGKPRRKTADSLLDNEIDTTPFNADKWLVKVGKIDLKGCGFNLTANDKVPETGVFDQAHIHIKNILTSVTDATIVGDTIRGQVNQLNAEERCGIVIRRMRSKVTVSPIASVCENLYLETGHSKIKDYYAMRYHRFPNFLEYIDSVRMEGRLQNATIDMKDIAYFAPELKTINSILTVSGQGKGTVADLGAQRLNINDGISTLKGDITLKGLPDIYKTKILLTNINLQTSGRGVFKYAPSLARDTDIALNKISQAQFIGKYEGMIEDFAVDGSLKTDIGNISVNMAMKIPEFRANRAEYKGKVVTENFQLGNLFRQPTLGNLTCNEVISGSSFDPENALVDVDGTITELGLNGYIFHNIDNKGILAKKEFNGTAQVNDPNLSLEFKGGFNYVDKDIKVNAEAHLLYCNLKAIHLLSDSTTASADFDLNCHGSNIDNFSGYALLNNIDIKHKGHKVYLDSIMLNSSTNDDGMKVLSIESNEVTAQIEGNYQLSALPASVQYYLNRYIPNYINPPVRNPPDQNISFDIHTRNIDSILAVTTPFIRGFDKTEIKGSLNTIAKKLSLTAKAPFGVIGRVRMSDLSVNGEGDFESIGLNTTVGTLSVGDSFFNSALGFKATVANDSVNFTVTTVVADTSTSITLNGIGIAKNDSFSVFLNPSDFFLNRAKWSVAGGSKIIYSNKYLSVNNLSLISDLQKLNINTKNVTYDHSLIIDAEELDLGQFGMWAGMSVYQPDGRLNGTIAIDNIFDAPYISANLKCSKVKFGNDTLGTIDIIGFYDAANQHVHIDPQTGVYRDNSSISAEGDLFFDSTVKKQLDGKIVFNDAKASWASPFLTGILSKLSGTLNGSILLAGSSTAPELSGTLGLRKAGFKVDYTGCTYSLPLANINVTNDRISYGNVTLFDSYNNVATISGRFTHHLFANMKMDMSISSEKFEALRLTQSENNIFYGNVIASVDSFTLKGPFNNLKLHGYNLVPAAESHIYIPVGTTGEISSYSYVSFKTYGKNVEKPIRKIRDKLTVDIDAGFNNLATMTIVLDPLTGDAIDARGEGNVQLSIPPGNDMRITGIYTINEGSYKFTFKQLLGFNKSFRLNSGSKITFNGPFYSTQMDVNATYFAKARLYDLLNDNEISSNYMSAQELTDSKTAQQVNVLLHMAGTLKSPQLSFGLDLPEKRNYGSYAYTKFDRLNIDDRQRLDQVASLLLINAFIPPDGLGSSTVGATVLANNMTQVLTSSFSTGLTNALNKLLGDKSLNIDIKYNNYNYYELGSIGTNNINRNQVKVGVSKPFFNDKLLVEVGSTSDWGRPANQSSSNTFNITGDFRIQYILSQASGLRFNAFRTSDYDVTLEKDITRSGVGISWRKSFDNFNGLITKPEKAAKKEDEIGEHVQTDSTKH